MTFPLNIRKFNDLNELFYALPPRCNRLMITLTTTKLKLTCSNLPGHASLDKLTTSFLNMPITIHSPKKSVDV